MDENWIDTTEEEGKWAVPGGCACVIIASVLGLIIIGVAIYVGLS